MMHIFKITSLYITISILAINVHAQNPISSNGGANGSRVWFVNAMSMVERDFATVQEAIDDPNVLDGDTIYVEQAGSSYGDVVLDKQLYIIGTGYWLDVNDSMQHNTEGAHITSLTFVAGSENSAVMGLSIDSAVHVNKVDSVMLQHNYIAASEPGPLITIDSAYRVLVFQNYIYNSHNEYSLTVNWTAITINGPSSMIYIEGNMIFMRNHASSADGEYHYPAIRMTDAQSDAVIRNNIINGNLLLRNAIFENNIILRGTTYENYTYGYTFNNLYGTDNDGTTIITNNGTTVKDNQYVTFGTFEAGVFQTNLSYYQAPIGSAKAWTAMVDSVYILKAGSPALGAGADGVDCGMFGGNVPYALSGMPFIPSVFYFEGASFITGGTMDVRVKSRAHE